MTQSYLAQPVTVSKERLSTLPLFEYNFNAGFVGFYENIPPGDTVFRLGISYDGYEDHLLSCLQSPLFKYVQELTINGTFDELPSSIRHLKQLKALFVRNHDDGGCEGHCPVYIPNEIYHLPELEVLSISTNNISITDSIIHLKKLKHLYISPASLLPCLFTGMPQLQSIGLNIYTPSQPKYIKAFNKIIMFNNYPYRDVVGWHYSESDKTDIAVTLVKPEALLNETIDIQLKDPYDKKNRVFTFKGQIKNNEPVGPWIVKSEYSLLANYSHGKSEVTRVMMNDTTRLAIVTKNNKGEETQEFRNVKKHFKNGMPHGNWEYHQYTGKCYQQIMYDVQQSNSAKADTNGYFIRKTFVNGKAYGTWKEYTGYSIKTTIFENGRPVKITDREKKFTTPNTVKEFKYDDTKTGIYTFYRKTADQLYLHSQEFYNNYIPDGEFINYYQNGIVQNKKTYNNGKITGDAIGNYDNGKPAYVNSYDKGLIKHERRFHQNGTREQEVYYNSKGKDGTENIWSEAGKLKESTFYDNGLPYGLSQKFDDKGNVVSEKYYEQGLAIYDEGLGFDPVFSSTETDKLFHLFYQFKMESTCCRHANCTLQKKIIDDSTFAITEHQYTETHGRHLKYIKEFGFKNYKLSGVQVLKDSAGNIIQYVHCKEGLKDGKFTLVHRNDSLSINYNQNRVIDTVLTYTSKNGRKTEVQYYKNMRLYKVDQFYYSHTGKPTGNIVIEYVKAKQPRPSTKYDAIHKPLSLIMGLPKNQNSMFFIPETLTEYIDGKKISTVKFHAKITEVNCMNVRRMKGYAIADGKRYRFIEEDEIKYEYWFRIHSVFNIFFNGMITCY